MRIGILGGTFDPPHAGHLALAHAARDQLKLDEVILMPANRNPHKSAKATIPKHRFEMVKLAVEGEPGLAASDLEITRGGLSYTVETLAELAMAQPAEYWWILGADALRDFGTWKQPERILRLARLAAAVRPPMSETDVRARLSGELKEHVDIVRMNAMDVSSTDLRSRLERKQTVNPWIAPRVLRYIQEHRLYTN